MSLLCCYDNLHLLNSKLGSCMMGILNTFWLQHCFGQDHASCPIEGDHIDQYIQQLPGPICMAVLSGRNSTRALVGVAEGSFKGWCDVWYILDFVSIYHWYVYSCGQEALMCVQLPYECASWLLGPLVTSAVQEIVESLQQKVKSILQTI